MLHKTTLRKALLISLLALLIASQAGTALAGTNIWTSLGPEGVYITTVVIDPSAPGTLYAGTWGGGVFKSTNSGATWSMVNIGLTDSKVHALAIDPATPSTLYAGTYAGGMFKSTNGGKSWSAINKGLTFTEVQTLAIDPAIPSTIYAGTWGRGVFKSTNGGGKWVYVGLLYACVFSLAIDPTLHNTLYAGIAYGGVFKSADGGGNWVNIGFNQTDVHALAIDPTMPTILYAGTFGPYGDIYKSTNGGEGWVRTGLRAFGSVLTIDPMTPSTLYAGTDGEGVFMSINGGGSWCEFNTGLTDRYIHSLAIVPTSLATPYTIYAGTKNGVFAIQQVQIPALLIINHSSGAPGSTFTITGSNFPLCGTASMSINGKVLGMVTADSSGGFTLLLKTNPTTQAGYYHVTASGYPGAMIQFSLAAGGVVRPQEGSGTVFDVPDGIAYQNFVNLPLMVK